MTDIIHVLRQALLALENGKRVRCFESGTLYQPPLEDAAIADIRTAMHELINPAGHCLQDTVPHVVRECD